MMAENPTGALSSTEWSLRDELFAATHRWYVIVLFCLIGSLLGWLLSWIWPSPYQASKELFVGLNISATTRSGAPIQPPALPVANANDYKNWQMASLNTVIFTDAVISETLARLRILDPRWNAVDQEGLAAMLRVYWRNAGKWRLAAEHADPLFASQAVTVWETVVVESVHYAVEQSQTAQQLDLQLQTATAALAAADARLAALNLERQQAQSRGENTAGLDTEIQAITAQADGQRQIVQALSEHYRQAVSAGLGLAPELVVQKLSDRKLRQSTVRPTGQAMLIGAALGWIAWLLIWLVRLGRKARL
jgi:hypothetical protein